MEALGNYFKDNDIKDKPKRVKPKWVHVLRECFKTSCCSCKEAICRDINNLVVWNNFEVYFYEILTKINAKVCLFITLSSLYYSTDYHENVSGIQKRT